MNGSFNRDFDYAVGMIRLVTILPLNRLNVFHVGGAELSRFIRDEIEMIDD